MPGRAPIPATLEELSAQAGKLMMQYGSYYADLAVELHRGGLGGWEVGHIALAECLLGRPGRFRDMTPQDLQFAHEIWQMLHDRYAAAAVAIGRGS